MGSLARESPLPLKLPQFWPDIEKLRKIAEPLSSFRSGRTIEDLFYDLNHLIFRWKLSEM